MDLKLIEDIFKCQNTKETQAQLMAMSEVDAWFYLRGLRDCSADVYQNFVETTIPEKAIFKKVVNYLTSTEELTDKYIRQYSTKDPEVTEKLEEYKNAYGKYLN